MASLVNILKILFNRQKYKYGAIVRSVHCKKHLNLIKCGNSDERKHDQ